jgi:RNA polymerase sigma factor (TIGR02999 family)
LSSLYMMRPASRHLTESSDNVTDLLRRMVTGDKDAESHLIGVVYRELHQIARRLMRREGDAHTLQATALVNEAYIRLAKPRPGGFNDRIHFFAVAATVMRGILVDHARAKRADKRGGGLQPLDAFLEPSVNLDAPELILAIDAALTRLAGMDDRQARIVELRFFAGMTVDEIASALEISPRTVKREWQLAKAWLYGELNA